MSTMVFPIHRIPTMPKEYNIVNGTSYNPETPEAVIRVLESCRASGIRIRVHYGDRATGHDWHEENDCEGRVGRTMGPSVKAPVLLYKSSSHGGGVILDRCIVGIRTTGKSSKWLYKHPTYRAKVFEVHMVECDRGYTAEVRADGEAVARFKTPASAFRYISKVAGPLTNYV